MPRTKHLPDRAAKYVSVADRKRQRYVSKDPAKRARSLANLALGRGKGPKKYAGLKPAMLKAFPPGTKLPHEYGDDIIGFAEHHHILKSGQPITLLPWQRKVLTRVFYRPDGSRPKLAIAGSVKKSGKSELAAVVANWFLTNVKESENFILAPDFEAGQMVVFSSLISAIKRNPILCGAVKITKDRVEFILNGSFVQVLAANISVAGLRPNLTIIDECWAFRNESSGIRVLDEMTTNPCENHLTFVTTTAGYQEDQSEDLHLWRWYSRGMAIKEGKEPADKNFMFFWKTNYKGVPWVEGTNYLDHQRKILKPSTFARFHTNQWTSSISTFVTPEILDRCIDPALHPGAKSGDRIVVGLDCGPKHDATAIVALAKDETKPRGLRLVDCRIWQQSGGSTLEFEQTIEHTLLDWQENCGYRIIDVYYDPYSMLATAQSLRDKGIRMTEYLQTVPNMVEATSYLTELLHTQNLRLYPHPVLRQHILSASTKEHPQGLRLVKTQASKKIDAAIALCLAVKAAYKHLLRRGDAKPSGIVYSSAEGDMANDELFHRMHPDFVL